MPFEFFVAIRYLISDKSQSLLILAAASTGVAVLVFVYALISGLQTNLIEQTLGSEAHIVVQAQEETARPLAVKKKSTLLFNRIEKGFQRPQSIDNWQQKMTVIASVPDVLSIAPVVSGSAFVNRGNADKSVMLRGVNAEDFVNIIPILDNMVFGEFRLQGTDTVIGIGLAEDLGTDIGDKIRIIMPDGRAEVFAVSGVFDLSNKDINHRWVFVSLRSAQTLLDLSGGVTTINAKVKNIFDARKISDEIERRIGLPTDSWMELNEKLLIALRSQSSSSYMIQVFVMIAVALGIASVLIVSVVQKRQEIGIMRSFGVSRRSLILVFLIQGGVVGLLGSAIGSVLGSILALIFEGLAREPDGSPRFPVDLNVNLFLIITLITTGIGLLAAVLPARKSASVDPIEVIR